MRCVCIQPTAKACVLVILFSFTMMASTTTTVRALSTGIATTDAAKIMAQNFETFQLKKLKEAGLLGVQRPVTIVATTAAASAKNRETNHSSDSKSEFLGTFMGTKTVHFQRHGQGYHNLIGEMYRDILRRPIDLDDRDPATNPFLRPEMCDSPLTEKGRLECAARREEASVLKPQIVIVSPLHRAIQTAMLSFADFRTSSTSSIISIPWMAHEGAREQHGLLQCNKRRSVTDAQLEFPSIDFSAVESNHDVLWQPEARESPTAETERIYDFLTDFLMARGEDELAVVGHSAWLFTMCNAVVDCGDDAVLKSLFKTSEIRSMQLSFYRTYSDTE
jgi:broad specificity phosphatase PhoE